MKHLQTFESFLNEANQGNPLGLKVGDLIRYECKSPDLNYFKKALYGKIIKVESYVKFCMIAVGWSDKSKQAPEFMVKTKGGKIASGDNIAVLTDERFDKKDMEKEIERLEPTSVDGNLRWSMGSNPFKLKNCTIWNP